MEDTGVCAGERRGDTCHHTCEGVYMVDKCCHVGLGVVHVCHMEVDKAQCSNFRNKVLDSSTSQETKI